MSLITKNNYEAFLLDYIEGNLSPEMRAELMLFFENHPELKEDLDDFELVSTNPEEIIFKDKESLKVEEDKIGIINYEDAIIAKVEGIISEKESTSLLAFLKHNPEKEKELKLYEKTKLVAPAITFNDKEELKQKEDKVIPLYWWYSAAAAVILALFLLKGINWTAENTELPIAEEKHNVLPIENNETENKENFVEENIQEEELAIQEQKEPIQKKSNTSNPKKKIIEKNSIKVYPEIIDEKKEDLNLANNETVEPIKKDSISLPIIKEVIKNKDEEVLYADDVKITYEDEIVADNTNNGNPNGPNKISKLRLLKEVLTSKVKDKVLDEETDSNGEVVAYAFNVGPFNFTKNRK